MSFNFLYTCILFGLIPNLLWLVCVYFQYWSCRCLNFTACQLTNKFLCYFQDNELPRPNGSGQKYTEGIYYPDEIRQPRIYSLGSEVFLWLKLDNIHSAWSVTYIWYDSKYRGPQMTHFLLEFNLARNLIFYINHAVLFETLWCKNCLLVSGIPLLIHFIVSSFCCIKVNYKMHFGEGQCNTVIFIVYNEMYYIIPLPLEAPLVQSCHSNIKLTGIWHVVFVGLHA